MTALPARLRRCVAAARGDVGALYQMEAWVAEECMIRAEVAL